MRAIVDEETCIGCGLEADGKSGYPSVEMAPCTVCSRNPAIKDRWNEAWTIDETNIPFIERQTLELLSRVISEVGDGQSNFLGGD